MANKIPVLTQLKAVATAAKNFTMKNVSELAETSANAIEEIESVKADKSKSTAFTLPTSGWKSDSTATYPYYYDISVAGVTTYDRASVSIAPASMDTAISCRICPTSQTLAGIIRIRSAAAPAKAISCEYWIEQGKA